MLSAIQIMVIDPCILFTDFFPSVNVYFKIFHFLLLPYRRESQKERGKINVNKYYFLLFSLISHMSKKAEVFNFNQP